MGQLVELSAFDCVSPLFEAYDFDQPMFGSVLAGHTLGHVFVDQIDEPRAALVCRSSGECYLAGKPDGLDVRAAFEDVLPEAGWPLSRWEIFAPEESAWHDVLKDAYGDRLSENAYHYFVFSDARKDWIASWPLRVPKGFAVQRMDRMLADKTCESFNLPLNRYWGSMDQFLDCGFGTVVLNPEDEVVSLVALYALGHGEAEIEIATLKAYRRRGLGSLAACAFIEICWEENVIPSWACEKDNAPSKAMALSLGFDYRFLQPCYGIENAND